MANVVFRLSSKRSGDKSELLVRFYASRVIDLRAHTRLFVPTELWNDKMQRLLIPRRRHRRHNRRNGNTIEDRRIAHVDIE